VGPPHRDGRGPQGDVIGDYRTLEPQAQPSGIGSS
jgi:hypothetical protein